MDLTYTPEHDAFREELRAWLGSSLPGPMPKAPDERLAFLRAWQRTLADAGWAAPHWPVEQGGRDAGIVEQMIYHEEFALHRAPPLLGAIGVGLLGPTLITHGTPEQKTRFLRPMLSADHHWCQGFSEPNAGSDLASLKTRAELHGDAFVVNGRKIWTSGAQIANWTFALVRTDPNAAKHEGISFLLIDMASPGIDVRPIKQISGESEFSEVTFTDVAVPTENVVGGVNRGWGIAHTALGHERSTLFLGSAIRYERIVRELIAMARDAGYHGGPASADPEIRQELARALVDVSIMRTNGLRTLSAILSNGEPGPQSSIGRLFVSQFEQRLHSLAMRLQGPQGLLARRSPHAREKGRWQHGYLRTRASTIGTGTSEIQRNIIAERVLGFPSDREFEGR
ncbi:MAG: acyl-CoA dehydrogenase family protein [Actinomycetota bacterium]